jgi:hypothetical protein
MWLLSKTRKTGKEIKMKTELKTIVFCLLAFALSGCVPVVSVHPLFSTEDELIFDPNLLGLWKATDSNETWQFSQAEDPNVYELVVTDNNGKQGNFIAALGELEDNLFLVIYPEMSDSQKSDFYKLHILGLCSFMKVEQIDPNLKIAITDDSRVNKIIETDPNIIKHETPKINSKLILTAKTEELQEFVVEYGINADDANSIFGEPAEFIRIAQDANDNPTTEEQ